MKRFASLTTTSVVPALVFLSFPRAADMSGTETGVPSIHMIAAALLGASFAAPVFMGTVKSFIHNRSQRDKAAKKEP